MTNAIQQQTNFTAGELSPYLQSRTDLQQYGNSAQTINNFIVRHQGGLLKRPGTVFVREIKNSANDVRLIPFEYSNTDAYVIEMGAGYFRFYRDGGIVLSSAAITNGTFDTDLTGWTDGDTGTGASTFSAGVMRLAGGAAGEAIRTQSVANTGIGSYTLTFTSATNTCVYRIGTTSGGVDLATGTSALGVNVIPFTTTVAGTIYVQFRNANNNNADVDTVSLSTPPYEISNPFSQDQLDDIQFAQSYDIIYFTHNSHEPSQLTRTGHAIWTLADVTFVDGPYFDLFHAQYGGRGGSGITLTASAATGSGITLTASAALFVSTDVGRLVRQRPTAGTDPWGWARITAYTSSTVVTITIERTLTSTVATDQWRLGAWSNTTGFPAALSFFEQRFVFANSTTQKQTIWFSKSGDLTRFQPDDDNFEDSVIASSAMTYTIADNKANIINWIASQKVLLLGTSSGVWLVSASSTGQALTPDNISIKPIINEGSAARPPLVTRTAIIYPQRFKRKLLEIGYNFSDDNYRSADLALLAEHRTMGNIKWLTTQVNPNYLVWMTTEDGQLNGLTYVREQNVIGWHQHNLGGTDVEVKTLCTIPTSTEDQVWMVTSRTIDGSTVQYVEYLSPYFIEQDVEEAAFVDSYIAYSGASTDTLSGLDHLEGETVQVFGNGGQVVATSVVTAGAITLDEEVTTAVVGLGYTSQYLSNAIDVPMASGTVQGRRGRAYKAAIQLYRSFGGQIGSSLTDLDVMPEYSSETLMDEPLTLTTGVVEFRIPSDYQFEPHIAIVHGLPVPFNLTGIITSATFNSVPTARSSV
jgi:hypothetical protein